MNPTEQARYDAARKVMHTAYEGLVFWELGGGDCDGEGFFTSVAAVRAECERDDTPPPAFVWGCVRQRLHMNAESVLEFALESGEYPESSGEHVAADELKLLQAMLDFWCERQDVHAWEIDYTTAVIL